MKQLIFLIFLVIGQNSFAQLAAGNSQITQPTAPTYENCERTTTDSEGNTIIVMDQACMARNQSKQQQYNLAMAGYNQALQLQQQQQQQAQSAEQARLAQQAQLNSAKAAAESAQNKNKEGSQIYQLASIGCGIASGYYATQFAASCSGGATCQMPLLYKAIAFAGLAILANQQASSHDQVANNACQAAGKMSGEGGSCGGAPPPYNPQSYPQPVAGGTGVTSLFGPDGKCIGKQADCDRVTNNLPPGVNIKDGVRGLSAFASGTNKPFSVDKDGKIITRDGKKIDPNSLNTEQGLTSLGISGADAKGILAGLNGGSGGSGSNSKDPAKDMKSPFDQSFGDATAGGVSGPNAKGGGANGDAKGSKDIGGGKRGLASAEGLAKDFNGEMIGVAGDDIFKMMNRRYKLKTSQDNFIAP